MKNNQLCSKSLILFFLFTTIWVSVQANTIMTSDILRAKHHPKKSNSCFKKGKCNSPEVSHHTRAILTVNSFEKGREGGGPSACDNKFHSDNTHIVALSTGWFNHGKRCHHQITIFANGRRVNAVVVDECDSSRGCPNNVVDASKAVWKALGLNTDKGEVQVFWSDA